VRARVSILIIGFAVTLAACSDDGPAGDDVEVGAFVLERDDTGEEHEVPVVPLDEDAGDSTSAAEAPRGAVDLDEGFLRGGLSWAVDEGEWVETSSQVLDREVPFVAADLAGAVSPDEASRPARCRVSLRAPEDRGLSARGHLAVDLVVTGPDGREVRIPSHRLVLDLGLGPGQRVEGPPGAPRTVSMDEVDRVHCTTSYTPA
jgi:hypothetical protein